MHAPATTQFSRSLEISHWPSSWAPTLFLAFGVKACGTTVCLRFVVVSSINRILVMFKKSWRWIRSSSSPMATPPIALASIFWSKGWTLVVPRPSAFLKRVWPLGVVSVLRGESCPVGVPACPLPLASPRLRLVDLVSRPVVVVLEGGAGSLTFLTGLPSLPFRRLGVPSSSSSSSSSAGL